MASKLKDSTPQTHNVLYFPFTQKAGGVWFLCDDDWDVVTRGFGYEAYMKCEFGSYFEASQHHPVIPGGILIKLTPEEFQAIPKHSTENWGTTDQDVVPMPLSEEYARQCAEEVVKSLISEMMAGSFTSHCRSFRSLEWTKQEYYQIEDKVRAVLIDEITAKLQSIRRS